MFTLLSEALLLGLSASPACLASCGPVLLPMLMSAALPWRRTARLLALFLVGRMSGYLLFAWILWTGLSVLQPPGLPHPLLLGAIDLLLATALIGAGVLQQRGCAGSPRSLLQPARKEAWLRRAGRGAPLLLGLLTGISWCPPFLAASAQAAQLPSAIDAILFFQAFFIGTALWFVPLPALGALHLRESVVGVARWLLLIIGAYYLYRGLLLLGGYWLHE